MIGWNFAFQSFHLTVTLLYIGYRVNEKFVTELCGVVTRAETVRRIGVNVWVKSGLRAVALCEL
jgi:hypothetical protein